MIDSEGNAHDPGAAPDDAPIVIQGEIQGSDETASERPLAPEPAAAVDAAAPRVEKALASGGARPAAGAGAEAARVSSLDALRGLFVIAITLTFALYGDWYPTWMYHRQFPPPGTFVDVGGITWLDVPYAGFIFTAAAAIPIALTRRVNEGMTEISVVIASIRRFLLLTVFALLIGHSNTYFTGYTQNARLAALIGFAVMFALFVQRRGDWDPRAIAVLNALGWIGALAFLAAGPLLYGGTFSVERHDQVIFDIAFAALVGSILWYFTRDNLGVRLAALAGAVALHLGAHQSGWIQSWWWDSPAPWLLSPAKLVLLAIVVPGTMVGDLLVQWARSAPTEGTKCWRAARSILLAFMAAAFFPVMVIGLYTRSTVGVTAQLTAASCIAGVLLSWNPGTARERLIRRLFLWGGFWMLLGLFLEPAEGGIKKVPETLSYFFVMAGLSTMLLLAFIVFMEAWARGAWARSLVEVGRNPMLAYVLFSIFLNSLLELVPPFRGVLRATPAQALLRSLLSTVIAVLIVQAFTRRRVIWRT